MRTLLVENEHVKFEIENFIMIGTIKAPLLDISSAKKITNDRLEIQKNKSYPLISNIKFLKNSTKEARDYMASKEGCQGVLAAAILINSPIDSMIGNFFINISKPIVPTKIFTVEEEAKNWLKQYIAY